MKYFKEDKLVYLNEAQARESIRRYILWLEKKHLNVRMDLTESPIYKMYGKSYSEMIYGDHDESR